MAQILIPCYPADRELFPCAHGEAQQRRESTTFYNDFKIAEQFGFRDVVDTWKRAWHGWKTRADYVTELCVVVNHLGWEHYQKNEKLSKFYFDRFHEINAYVYKSDDKGENIGPFTDEEVSFFWAVMD